MMRRNRLLMGVGLMAAPLLFSALIGEQGQEGGETAFEATAAPDVELRTEEAPSAPPEVESPASRWSEEQKAELEKAYSELRPGGEPGGDSAIPPGAPAVRGMGGQLLQYVVNLLVVLGLILLTLYGVNYLRRRLGWRTPLLSGPDYAKILAHVGLSRQASLYFIECNGRILVLGATEHNVSLLTSFDKETFQLQAGAPASQPRSFAGELQEQTRSMAAATAGEEDEKLTSLRGDIERFHKFLQESAREGDR